MLRIIPRFILAISALIFINSCDVSMYGTYTFYHQVTYSLQDDTDEAANENMQILITEYLSKYIDLDKTLTYTGSYSEAVQYGNNYLYEIFDNFYNDAEELTSRLQTGEYIQYAMYMTGENTKILLGYYIWLPQENEEDETENEDEAEN